MKAYKVNDDANQCGVSTWILKLFNHSQRYYSLQKIDHYYLFPILATFHVGAHDMLCMLVSDYAPEMSQGSLR